MLHNEKSALLVALIQIRGNIPSPQFCRPRLPLSHPALMGGGVRGIPARPSLNRPDPARFPRRLGQSLIFDELEKALTRHPFSSIHTSEFDTSRALCKRRSAHLGKYPQRDSFECDRSAKKIFRFFALDCHNVAAAVTERPLQKASYPDGVGARSKFEGERGTHRVAFLMDS